MVLNAFALLAMNLTGEYNKIVFENYDSIIFYFENLTFNSNCRKFYE